MRMMKEKEQEEEEDEKEKKNKWQKAKFKGQLKELSKKRDTSGSLRS